jgi:succinoglycan biosynthesis transport protein ExoP
MHGSAAMNDDAHPGVLASLWKYRGTSAAIVSVVVLLSVGVGFLAQPRGAQAKATIALSSPPAKSVLAPGVQGDASLARYTAQRAAYVTSDAVLRTVAASLRRSDITKLRRAISATASTSSNTIVIVADADTDREAVQLAAATVAAYRSETTHEVQRLTDAAIASIAQSSRRVQADASAGSKSISTTVSQLAVQASEIRVSSALFGDGVDFVAAPRADAVTRASIPLREAALGLVLGLLLAATAAWIRADRTRFTESAPREFWPVRVTSDKSIALYPTAPARSWPERTR